MSHPVVGVQPNLLRWARESHGYSISAVAEKLKRDPSEIVKWENGESAPTYPQLEKLAYEIYHRPLAVFFFPEPPQEAVPQQVFRSLSDTRLEQLEPQTRYRIRLAMALQQSVRNLHNNQNPNLEPIFKRYRLSLEKPSTVQAKEVRALLYIDLSTQLSWRSEESAFKAWRTAIENAGVYVFKNTFAQKSISGFCLLDPEFPIIYLNNSTTETRQIFSLLHELAHILLQTSAVSSFDLPEAETDEYSRIERFCNAFAAEVLMPSTDFNEQIRNITNFNDEDIKQLAVRYCVSREAVMRRLLDLKRVDQQQYQDKANQWKAQQGESSLGGSYYATQSAYLGERYLNLVFQKYSRGELSVQQMANHLGMKARNAVELEQRFSAKGINA